MRGFLPALVVLLAGLPAAAWEPPAQHEWAALLGQEPFAGIQDAGIPLPPSREEAMAAAPLHYGLQREAIKYALVCRTAAAKAARNRISPELNRAVAGLARRRGAPELFCRYLELMSGQELGRRQQYELRQAFNYLVLQTYGVDMLQIRIFSEGLQLPEKTHLAFMLSLPLAFMFDPEPPEEPARETLLGDIRTMTQVLRRCHEILGGVHDRASADAAAEQLKELLPLWSTTLRTRAHSRTMAVQFLPHENLALQLLDSTTSALVATRRRLHEKQWFNSARLVSVDELFR
jgi:hypothetical protein